MKSSTAIQLTIMTGMVTAMAVTVYGDGPSQSFSSVAECTKSGKPEALCQATYKEALDQHHKLGPRYDTEEECRADLDVTQCVGVDKKESDGSIRHVIMPAMTGYLVGKGLRRDDEDQESWSKGVNETLGYAHEGGVYHGNPLYRSKKDPGGYWTVSEVGSSGVSKYWPNVGTTTVARRGFGAGRISGSS